MHPKKPEITTTPPIDTIVHLGAGQCSELANYLTLRPRQMLLVEADPELAADLQKRTADLEQVAVKCAAVAGNPGAATFRRFNVPEWNSLHAASGLLALFPGLKTVQSLQVETVSPVALLQPLQLQPEQQNRLILDLPGEELPVLQALKQARFLHLFEKVYLQCAHEALYEGSESAARVLQWLKKEGFDLENKDDSRDPDRPCWTLQRNALQLRNRELENQVEALRTQIEMLNKANEEAIQLATDHQQKIVEITQICDEQAKAAAGFQTKNEKLSQACKEKDKAVAELMDQLKQLTQTKTELTEARDEQKKLLANRQREIEQLTRAHEEQAKLAADRQHQIDQLTQARDGQTKLAAERQTQITQLTQARDEQTKLVDERQAHIEVLNKAKDELAKQTAERQQVIESQKKKLDESMQKAVELKAQIQQLTIAHDDQKRLSAERLVKFEQLTKALDEQTKLADERQQQVGQLTQARDEQAKLAGERQAQLEQLTRERDEKVKLVAERQQKIAELTKAKEASSKEAAELRSRVTQLTQERDAQCEFAGKRPTQIEQLTKTQDEQTKLAAERQEQLEQLTKAKEEQAKLAGQRQAQIKQLNKAMTESKVLGADRQQEVSQLSESMDERTRLDGECKLQVELIIRNEQMDAQVNASDDQIVTVWHRACRRWNGITLINSIPKSGTYLVSLFLMELGLDDSSLHLRNDRLWNFKDRPLDEIISDPDQFLKKQTLRESIVHVRPGEFCMAHLEYTEDAIEAMNQFNIHHIFLIRNLRDALVSHMRFVEDKRRIAQPGAWVAEKDNKKKLVGYMKKVGCSYLRGFSRQLNWINYPGVFVLKYEDLVGDFGVKTQLSNISNVLNITNIPMSPDDALNILKDKVLGKPTRTYSGSRSKVADYWSEEAEEVFTDHLGLSANQRLGYE